MVRTATEQLKLTAEAASDPATRAAMEKQIEAWQTAARYDFEPESHEGRKELAETPGAEESRDIFLAKYHAYAVRGVSNRHRAGVGRGNASMVALAWLSGLLGAGGLAVMALGSSLRMCWVALAQGSDDRSRQG